MHENNNHTTTTTLGICLGASTISAVRISRGEEIKTEEVIQKTHGGNPRKTLKEMLSGAPAVPTMITGRKFRKWVGLPSVAEVEAVEKVLQCFYKKIPIEAVVSAGSETFIVYLLDKNHKIKGVSTGSKCASGTGEFFLQQIRRMGLDADDAVNIHADTEPYKISGRCSVFCKSDCTHALNKGESVKNITAGLAEMMAKKILELLKKTPKKNVMLIGGVSKNTPLVNILKQRIENLIIPESASYFEALGAAILATEKNIAAPQSYDSLFTNNEFSFDFLPPLKDFEHLVTFKETIRGAANKGDDCILGLDVGSTTTKAALVRVKDNAIIASSYLRTLGDPIEASRNCFKEILPQASQINITALGVTGSGRHITGLYAQTPGVINEILAHATAAAYFDNSVNTIFEIGGQDAKYTYLNNGVPCDYAMNEACSAGTGSFLEEAAYESLGVPTEEIAGFALQAGSPPNFNDQCAAFIGSDIKNASQEGVSKEDILAGLVYSICMNYNNKVKGPRAVGDKIFMQGGVCYNKAVPVAMAGLIGRPIVVPPEPGLMGAFGVALEVKKRIEAGLLKEEKFDLKELIHRPIAYGKDFTCAGGTENCDRKCKINMIEVAGKSFPFGGACNKYYELRKNGSKKQNGADLARERTKMLFEEPTVKQPLKNPRTVGFNRSFMTHNFYPLYYNFFTRMGFKVILPEKILEEGIERKGAYFCHPVEAAHGYYLDLLEKKPDYIILPHIREMHVKQSVNTRRDFQATCQLLQAEPYILHAAFSDLEKDVKICGTRVLRPIFNFSRGLSAQENEFIKLAGSMGIKKSDAISAFREAVNAQDQFESRVRTLGARFLQELEKNPSSIAIALFGRPYNAFSPDINMGIPVKFTSRGISVIPIDFLPADDEECDEHMHWATGQRILKAASFTARHKQLFGCYITNFSCGPDSFLQKFFRDIMGKKPSLTLEIDSHTADAGVNTRIEAFLDIVERYRVIPREDEKAQTSYTPAKAVCSRDKIEIITSSGQTLDLKNPRVKMILPSMGEFSTQGVAKALSSSGINCIALPQPDADALKRGRANTSCKECLPLILITGMMDEYIEKHKPKDEVSVFFVPAAEGGCRLGQYRVALQNFVKKNQIENVAILSFTNENGYAGLPQKTMIKALQGIIISDIFDDIQNALYAIAKDKEKALSAFNRQWELALEALDNGNIEKTLTEAAKRLREIPLKVPFEFAPKVLLTGEIYVRKERFSSGGIVKILADKGIAVKTASLHEWMLYVDYMIEKGVFETKFNPLAFLNFIISNRYKKMLDGRYRRILAKSGLFDPHHINIHNIMEYGQKLLSIHVGGDPILSCGSSMKDILRHFSGVVLIGPFACMQSRTTEAILSAEFNPDKKKEIEGKNFKIHEGISGFPFLAIETDGNVLPQLIEAKLEAFALQVEHIHQLTGVR